MTGEATWYDFAKELYLITQNGPIISNKSCKNVTYFRTFAQRPVFSVLNTEKFTEVFGFLLPSWEKSLKKIIP